MRGAHGFTGLRGLALGLAGGLILATVLGQAFNSRLRAENPAQPQREAGGTIAWTTQSADASQFLYLVDTQNHSFAVYRIDPRDPKGAVKLEGARQYRWDLRLAEFNNQAPEVATIESMVGAPRR